MSHKIEYIQWSDSLSTRFEIAKNDNKLIRFLWPNDEDDYAWELCKPYYDTSDSIYKFKWDLNGIEVEIPLFKVKMAKDDLEL